MGLCRYNVDKEIIGKIVYFIFQLFSFLLGCLGLVFFFLKKKKKTAQAQVLLLTKITRFSEG